MDAAVAAGDTSIAFCCISTGVFGFPAKEAAEIAIDTVREWLNSKETTPETISTDESATSKGTIPTVIFNVYLDSDEALYRNLLGF